MSRTKVILVAIAAMMVISSFALVMNTSDADAADAEKGQWGGFIEDLGTRTFDDTWTPVSDIIELQNISEDLAGKYYLTNNIDLTNYSLVDSFAIEVKRSYADNKLTISLSMVPADGTVIPMYVSDLTILVNGKEGTPDGDEAKVTFEIGPDTVDLQIIAKGTVENIDSTYDKNFLTYVSFDAQPTTSKIVNSKGNFTPLGSSDFKFTGTIDGNGYSIFGLRTTTYTTNSDAYSGLIAYSEDATIKNLGLEEGSSVAISSYYARAGGLIGDASSIAATTNIINSYNTGKVIASSLSKPNAYAGGLVGYAASATTIADSCNKGIIAALSSTSNTYAGGLVGFANADITITDSYNTGTTTASSSSKDAYAGGLIGFADWNTNIENSYNTGTTTASSSSSSEACAGGLIGSRSASAASTITNSYNTGIIVASSSSLYAYAGGLIGQTGSSSTTITNSYNTGNITATSSSYSAYAGGLIGWADSTTITNSYNIGTITATSPFAYAGGLIGYAWDGGEINLSYSYIQSGTVAGNKLIGGFESNSKDDSDFPTSGPRTEYQMKDKNTFYNWNFSSPWKIDTTDNENKANDGYPYLDPVSRWENFIVDEGNEYVPEGTPIYTYGDLQSMTSGGKYYLANDIDLTAVNASDSFEIEVVVEVDEETNKATTSLQYKGSTLTVSDGLISINGVITKLTTFATATYTIPANTEELQITAGGTATTNVGGKDAVFAISITLPCTNTSIDPNEKIILQSKGNFTPLGSSDFEFTGTIDGNGYSIIGLRTTAYSSIGIDSGFISYASGATIKNLGLEGGSSVAISSSDYSCVGGLIGYAGSTTIINSYNTGTITASSSSSEAYAGGLIGYAGSTTITNSYNTGTITASSSSEAYAGGLIGYAYSTTIITNSYNTGTIMALSLSGAEAGGLIGYANSTTITNSYNTGIITATASSSNAHAGGLIGWARLTTSITNSYNVGEMLATGSTGSCTGGLIGYLESGTYTVTITSSYAETKEGDATELYGGMGNGVTYDPDARSGMKTETEMKGQGTFVGWDFVNVWKIDSNNNGYPYLGFAKTGWIEVNNDNFMDIMQADDFDLSGKYRLTEDIDLTEEEDPSAFVITMDVKRSGNTFTVTLKNGETNITVSDGMISINENLKKLNTGIASAEFVFTTIPDELVITAGGTGTSGIPDDKDKVFVITATIDTPDDQTAQATVLQSKGNFTPLGSSDTPFKGIIDGNGHSISGLRTTAYSSGTGVSAFSGLIGYAEDVTVKNLSIVESSSIAVSSSASARAGGIIGSVRGSATISNSYNTGDITASSSSAYVGGLIGYADSTTEISNSYNTGNITATATASFTCVGGLIGRAESTTITNSYNTGTITSSSTHVGGLIGWARSTTEISNSYNTGTIDVSSSGHTYVGGLIGHASSTTTIINSYNTGLITASSSLSNAHAGGLIGYASPTTITNSYNTGTITASSPSFEAYAGGLIGYADSTIITNSYNTGNITASSLADADTGGLIGRAKSTTTITNSYNVGEMLATGSSDSYIGGLIGHLMDGTYTATIISSYAEKGKGATNLVGRWGTNVNNGIDNLSDMKASELMKTKTTFENWEFETVWSIDTNINQGYPYLLLRESKDINVKYSSVGEGTIGIEVNGTPEGDNPATVTLGSSITLTMTPKEYYEVVLLLVNGKDVTKDIKDGTEEGTYTYTITNVISDINIFVCFNSKMYAVTPILDGGGTGSTISPSAAGLRAGTKDTKAFTFTVTPDTTNGYRIDGVEEEGLKVEQNDSKFTVYGVTSSTASLTINLSNEYKVTAELVGEPEGSGVTPGEADVVYSTGSGVFKVTPGNGYEVKSAAISPEENAAVPVVDGNNVTVNGVTDDCKVTITIGKIEYDVTAIILNREGGTVTNSPLKIAYEEEGTFNVSPDVGYVISDATVSSDKAGTSFSNEDNTVTVTNVTENCTVTITMGKMTYDVTITSTSGGKTSPSGTQTVKHGDSLSVGISPDNGYKILDVKVNGSSNSNAISSGKLNLSNITSNTSVNVSFAKDTAEVFYLNVYAGEGGNAYGSGYYEKGSQASIYALAKDGYKFKEWSNGSTLATTSVTVTDNMDIQAIFEKSSAWSGGGSSIGNDDIAIVIGVIIAIFGITAILGWAFMRKKG